jgi:hypothetical protein
MRSVIHVESGRAFVLPANFFKIILTAEQHTILYRIKPALSKFAIRKTELHVTAMKTNISTG